MRPLNAPIKFWGLTLAAVLAVASTADAAFIKVPTDQTTLGDAVAAAVDNDIIILESGNHFESAAITINQDNLAIIGEKNATLFAGNNDSTDAERNVFVVTSDGVRIKNIRFRPRSGSKEARAVVVLSGGDDFTFASNQVGKGKKGFTDAVFCFNDGDNLQVYDNEMRIVERRDGDGNIQGGNAAVTGLNGCDNMLVTHNKIKGPGPLPDRDTPATVGIIDFNNVPLPSAFNVQIASNEIEDFDTGIFVSSDNCIVEDNEIDDVGTGIQLSQGPSDFNDGADPARYCIVKRNDVRADADGIELEKGSDNLLLENDVRAEDEGIRLEEDSSDNLVRRNKTSSITDLGTDNSIEDNDDGDDDDDDD